MSAQAQNPTHPTTIDGYAAAYLCHGVSASYGVLFNAAVAAFDERQGVESDATFTAYKTRESHDERIDHENAVFVEWVSLKSFGTLDEAKAYVDTLREMDDDDFDDWGPNPPKGEASVKRSSSMKDEIDAIAQERYEREWNPYGDDDL